MGLPPVDSQTKAFAFLGSRCHRLAGSQCPFLLGSASEKTQVRWRANSAIFKTHLGRVQAARLAGFECGSVLYPQPSRPKDASKFSNDFREKVKPSIGLQGVHPEPLGGTHLWSDDPGQ